MSTNLHFVDLKEGVSYSVKGPYSDEYSFLEARISRGPDTLSVIFIEPDETGARSENSQIRTLVFKIELLTVLRNMGERYGVPENEAEFFISFLLEHSNFDAYNLDDLVESIGVGIEEAAMSGCFREWDAKYGTNLRYMVSTMLDSEWYADRAYAELCGYAANRMRNENVSLTWALRQFEKDSQNARGYSVFDILTLSVKTIDQLERDVLRLMKPALPSKFGPNYQEIDLLEAIELFVHGEAVYVEWDTLHRVQKNNWCELNINHLQRGKWFVKNSDSSFQESTK
ncbi:hypothetical protein L1N85_24655 [Paenibacillus alkaliterrae]|uniref:hypothetical protein n=1 Tax=Paenibacillus alkaliterrae TaxID=320909 RepID=UPI001F2288A0|nr:hypothetical protein [Paenibacillus alkaliterrae]MCF2941533.1 hypothetical protein [Paenibacillus alkaliterrae]